MQNKVLARLELAAFCVLRRRDNHYTTEPVHTIHVINKVRPYVERGLLQKDFSLYYLHMLRFLLPTLIEKNDAKEGSGEVRTRDLLRVKQT